MAKREPVQYKVIVHGEWTEKHNQAIIDHANRVSDRIEQEIREQTRREKQQQTTA